MYRNLAVTLAILAAALVVAVLAIAIGNVFPGLTSISTFGLLIIVVCVPASITVVRIRRGRLFTLLTFYSVLFLSEIFGGGLAATLATPLEAKSLLTAPELNRGLTVALAGYLVFLVGYGLKALGGKPRESSAALSERDRFFFRSIWSTRYQFFYFIALFLTVAASFIMLWQRVAVAGGVELYAETAYLYRFGTFAESEQQNAFVVLLTLVGNAALPLLGIGFIAWWGGHVKGNLARTLIILAACLLVVSLLLSGFRSTVFFPILAIIALYDLERRISRTQLTWLALLAGLLLLAVNFGHLFLYFLTADRDYVGFVESSLSLIAPHNHLETLVSVLEASDYMPRLNGAGFLESIFFFIPRLFWHTKLPSDQYGTLLVQTWAGLPNWYQKAITNVGELSAHFGLFGLFGMLLYGRLYRFLDTFSDRGVELRSAFCFLLLPRVLADAGMGLSAVSLTLFDLIIFLCIAYFLRHMSVHSKGTSRSHASARSTTP